MNYFAHLKSIIENIITIERGLPAILIIFYLKTYFLNKTNTISLSNSNYYNAKITIKCLLKRVRIKFELCYIFNAYSYWLIQNSYVIISLSQIWHTDKKKHKCIYTDCM